MAFLKLIFWYFSKQILQMFEKLFSTSGSESSIIYFTI